MCVEFFIISGPKLTLPSFQLRISRGDLLAKEELKDGDWVGAIGCGVDCDPISKDRARHGQRIGSERGSSATQQVYMQRFEKGFQDEGHCIKTERLVARYWCEGV